MVCVVIRWGRDSVCVCVSALMPASVDVGTICNMEKCSKNSLRTRVLITNEGDKKNKKQ